MGIPKPVVSIPDDDEYLAGTVVQATHIGELIKKITDVILYSLALNFRVSKPNDPLTDMNFHFASNKQIWRRTSNFIISVGQLISNSDKEAIQDHFYQYGFENIRFAPFKTYTLICFDCQNANHTVDCSPKILKLMYGKDYKEVIARKDYMIIAYLNENGKINIEQNNGLRMMDRAIIHIDTDRYLPDIWCFSKTFYGYTTVAQFNEQLKVSAEHEWYKLLIRPKYYCYAHPFSLCHIKFYSVEVENNDNLKVYVLAGGAGLQEKFLNGQRLFDVQTDEKGKMTKFIFGINLGTSYNIVQNDDLSIGKKIAPLIQKGLLNDVINGTEDSKIPSI